MIGRNRRGGFKRRALFDYEPSWITSEPTLWSMAWAGVNDEHLTTEADGADTRIVQINDISGNGRHYTRAVPGQLTGTPYYQPGLNYTGETWGAYSTALTPIARDFITSGQVFGQYLWQSASMDATGEFYLCCACTNTRDGGSRWIWGRDNVTDRVRLGQDVVGAGSNRISINIAGSTAEIASVNDGIPRGPVVIEVWRDGADDITVRANGVDVSTDPKKNMPGTFALSGFGGITEGSSSGWDDNMLTLVNCVGLPALSWRDDLVTHLRTMWTMT